MRGFIARPGLTDAKGVGFVKAVNRASYLRHADGQVRIQQISTAERACATFLKS